MMRYTVRGMICVVVFLVALSARAQVTTIDRLGPGDELALRLILSEQERREFDRLKAEAEKVRWAQKFWKRNDPTPTTERNERLEEHLRRVEYARNWYKAPNTLGFDDRGIIYVKYGEPSQRYVQASGDLLIRPNESWSYSDLIPGLVFDFVSMGPYYRLVDDLTQALGVRSEPGAELYNLLNLYESRAYIDPKYDRLAGELRRSLAVDMSENPLAPGQHNPFLGNLNLAQQQISEFAAAVKKAQAEAPGVIHRYDYGKKPLAIAQSLARFRDPSGKVRVEVYYGVPYNQLSFERRGDRWVTPLVERFAVFDEEYESVFIDSNVVELTAPTEAVSQRGAYISQVNLKLDPGLYYLALRFENAPGNRLGILRTDFVCPPFPSDSLRLSDLQLSAKVVSAAQGTAGWAADGRTRAERFVKHGVRIIPLPGSTIIKSRPLHIYFEIYGLRLDANRKANYEIHYRLRTLKEKQSLLGKVGGLFKGTPGLLSVTEVREGGRRDEFETIALDLSQQPEGTFLLEVVVRDLNSGMEARSVTPVKLVSGKS